MLLICEKKILDGPARYEMILHFSNKRFCSKRSTLLLYYLIFIFFSFSVLKMHFSWKFHINYYLCTLHLHWGIFFNKKSLCRREKNLAFLLLFLCFETETLLTNHIFMGNWKPISILHRSSNYCFVSPWIIWREESQFFQKAKRRALLIRTPQQSCPCLSILLNF